MFKIDVGNASEQQARECAAAVNQMISSKQKPDDQYFEKWFVLPVRDEGTSIELIYPPSDGAREQMEMRYDQFMEELDDILNRKSVDEYFEEDLNKACENGRFIGQIGYPIDDNRLEPVNLKNASHIVNSFSIEDGILWANVKVLDTPPGKILQGLLDRNLVVFRPVVEGSVERIGETDYARIKKFLGVHAINITEDSFNV